MWRNPLSQIYFEPIPQTLNVNNHNKLIEELIIVQNIPCAAMCSKTFHELQKFHCASEEIV